MPRVLRSAVAAAALAAAAVLLAGCGGSGAASPASTSTAAATTTARTGTSTPTGSAVPSASAKASVERATAKTESSTAKVEVRIVLRKPGASNILRYRATGVVAPGGGRLRIDRTSIGDEVAHEIFTHTGGRLVLYTSSPSTSQRLPKGKTWLKVDMAKYGQKRYGANTSFLAGSDQDPLQALELLASPAAKVADLGPDWLPDRTLNTHYRGTIDFAAAAKAAGATAKGLATLKSDLGDPTQTIDVWVNKKGAVARIVVKGPEKTGVGVLNLEETTDFTDYGTKASVSPPPAAKTADYFTLTAK